MMVILLTFKSKSSQLGVKNNFDGVALLIGLTVEVLISDNFVIKLLTVINNSVQLHSPVKISPLAKSIIYKVQFL